MRAHGPAAATLRRALAQLVETGIVIRRDSPNGKRYARRGQGGQVEQAFGFDLSPLVARAAEFERLADAVRAETRARMLLREEISLHRRDIAKTIAIGIEEELLGPWQAFGERLRRLGGMPPRSADRSQLEALAIELRALRLDVDKCLSENLKSEDSNVNESQSERHQQNSNTETPIEFELGFQGSQGQLAAPDTETKRPPQRAFPLGLVLEACPDIADYSRHGITSWRDFMATAGVVRSMLGISPSAWAEACAAMGRGGSRDHGGCHPAERGGDQESGWLSPQPDRTSEGWAVLARAGAHGAAASESRRWRPEKASVICRGPLRAGVPLRVSRSGRRWAGSHSRRQGSDVGFGVSRARVWLRGWCGIVISLRVRLVLATRARSATRAGQIGETGWR